jgi:tRNA pseudouridine55 synthase
VSKAKDILPIWQPVGFSTHQITKKIAERYETKSSHTGTLDPLAEGVVIVLLNEERLKKIEHAGWKKTYEFEVAFGLATDSYDALGTITKTNFKPVSENKLKQTLKELKGKYTQEVPFYSSVRYKGKRLFTYARKGIKVPLPKKEGEIFDIRLLSLKTQNAKETEQKIIQNLEKITGDFRQQQVITDWEKYFTSLTEKEEFTIAKIYAETSRGIYVRSLSQDIAKSVGVPGFVISLVRTKNGDYTKKECKTLEDIFGGDLIKIPWLPG